MKYISEGYMKEFDEIIKNLKLWVKNLPDDEQQEEKPPLGIIPALFWEKQVCIERQRCLGEAITRYLQRGMKVPEEWVDEYHELRAGINKPPTDEPECKKSYEDYKTLI